MTITSTSISLTAIRGGNGTITGTGPVTVMTQSGGTEPITWQIVGGSLPPGMVMDNTGRFGGSAQAVGSALLTVRATDSAAPPNIVDAAVTVSVS